MVRACVSDLYQPSSFFEGGVTLGALISPRPYQWRLAGVEWRPVHRAFHNTAVINPWAAVGAEGERFLVVVPEALDTPASPTV